MLWSWRGPRAFHQLRRLLFSALRLLVGQLPGCWLAEERSSVQMGELIALCLSVPPSSRALRPSTHHHHPPPVRAPRGRTAGNDGKRAFSWPPRTARPGARPASVGPSFLLRTETAFNLLLRRPLIVNRPPSLAIRPARLGFLGQRSHRRAVPRARLRRGLPHVLPNRCAPG